jgi:hypothetical protein
LISDLLAFVAPRALKNATTFRVVAAKVSQFASTSSSITVPQSAEA